MSAWDGRILKRMREEANLTQGELADLVGVKRDAIARWEASGTPSSREPGWSNVVALASALGVQCMAFLAPGTQAGTEPTPEPEEPPTAAEPVKKPKKGK